LVGDALRLDGAPEVADHDRHSIRGEVRNRRGAIGRSRVQHHAVSLIEQRLRRRPTKTIRAACDEDDRHAQLPYPWQNASPI